MFLSNIDALLNMQGKFFISVLEAKASRARGHSGHEAPLMTLTLGRTHETREAKTFSQSPL